MDYNMDYEGIEFPVFKKIFGKIGKKIFPLMSFVMKIILFILFTYQMKNLKTVWIYY